MVSNSKPISKIDQLIQSGLGHNLQKLAYYRVVMTDPHTGFNNMIYRDYAVEIMNQLVNYCLNDNQMYTRLRQLLLQDNRHINRHAFESLLNKSIEHGIPVETLVEVYNRGYHDNTTKHLTNEQHGFNRVNSYIANGEARRIDSDLAETSAMKTIRKVARGKHG